MLHGWDAAAAAACARGTSPSRASSVSAAAFAFALLRASEKRTTMATSSSLGTPLPRVPLAHPVARDHPAMEERGVAVVSWSRVPASRATAATRFSSRYRLHRRSSVPAGPFCCYCSCHYLSQSATWPASPRSRYASVRAGQSSRVGRRGHVPLAPQSS